MPILGSGGPMTTSALGSGLAGTTLTALGLSGPSPVTSRGSGLVNVDRTITSEVMPNLAFPVLYPAEDLYPANNLYPSVGAHQAGATVLDSRSVLGLVA